MWDKNDRFTRLVHAVLAIPLLALIIFWISLLLSANVWSAMLLGRGGLGLGACYIEYRLLKYAITGLDCLNNRED